MPFVSPKVEVDRTMLGIQCVHTEHGSTIRRLLEAHINEDHSRTRTADAPALLD